MKEKIVEKIKKNSLIIAPAILAMIANYIAAVSFFLILCGSLGMEEIRVGVLCAFAVVPFGFYALRCRCGKILLFLLGHLLAAFLGEAALLIGKSTLAEWIGYQLLFLVYIISSFYLRSKQRDFVERPLHPAVLAAVLTVGFWILNYAGSTRFQSVLLLLLIVFLVLYFAHYYLENYLSFISVNKISDKNFQKRKLLNSGMVFVGGYLGVLLILLLFFMNPVLGKSLASGMKTILLWILRMILLLFKQDESVPEPIVEENVAENPILPDEEAIMTEPGLLARILDQILEILLYVLFVAAFVAVIVWIVRKLRQIFGSSRADTIVESEASIQDITERIEREDRSRKYPAVFYGLSVNARIRKLFAKFMAGNKKRIETETKKPLSVVTAGEAMQALKADKQTAQIYEKARYSKEDSSIEEMRALKKQLSKVHE